MLHQNSTDFVFRNYTVAFRHVFEGLSYLEDQEIVHRDVKGVIILTVDNVLDLFTHSF